MSAKKNKRARLSKTPLKSHLSPTPATPENPSKSKFPTDLQQILTSNNKHALENLLRTEDETTIKTALGTLSPTLIAALLKELPEFINGRTSKPKNSTICAWINNLLQTCSPVILSHPDLVELLKPVLESVERSLYVQFRLKQLQARLKLFQAPLEEDTSAGEQNMLYNDEDNSDSNTSEAESDSEDHVESCESIVDSDVEVLFT